MVVFYGMRNGEKYCAYVRYEEHTQMINVNVHHFLTLATMRSFQPMFEFGTKSPADVVDWLQTLEMD